MYFFFIFFLVLGSLGPRCENTAHTQRHTDSNENHVKYRKKGGKCFIYIFRYSFSTHTRARSVQAYITETHTQKHTRSQNRRKMTVSLDVP